MKENSKTNRTYTKQMLIREIANECRKDVRTVSTVYNLLEENIKRILSTADQDTDVKIRLFDGISIDGTFIPERTKLNNLTGEFITTKSKIRPKAKITRYYCDKVTEYDK